MKKNRSNQMNRDKVDVSVNDQVDEKTFLDIFPDENLAAAIAEVFGRQPHEPVTIEELNNREGGLALSGRGIEDLEGLQHFTSIQFLALGNAPVRDLGPLRGMISLTNLMIANSEIHDLEPLKELTNLDRIYADNNFISDLDLRNLTSLRELWFRHNQLNDLSPLANLSNLEVMFLTNNEINSLEPLRELTSLEILILDFNHISQVGPLNNLTNLSWLALGSNRILDVSTLVNLQGLIDVHLQMIELAPAIEGEVTEGIFIKDQDGLTPPNLTFTPEGGSYDPETGTIIWGSLGENRLQWWGNLSGGGFFNGTILQYVEKKTEANFLDIFPDENLAQVVASRFNRQVTDEVSIDELNHLSGSIVAQSQNIKDLEGVQYLTSLASLIINDNQITNLGPLSHLTNLTGLNLAHNDVNNIEPLRGLSSLMVLDLSFNQISQVEPLGNLTHLLTFNLSNNHISDLSALTHLSTLFMAYSQLIELPPTAFGNFTQGIIIRNQNGQTPPLTSPTGVLYFPNQGMLAWFSSGQNSLSWNDLNFSGTITQYVTP